MSSGFTRSDGCDLCRAARITPWYYEDEICWVAECEICEVPMVVWRYHGTAPRRPTPTWHTCASACGRSPRRSSGSSGWDDHMRNIPDHWHAHGRPHGGFFGHGFKRKTP